MKKLKVPQTIFGSPSPGLRVVVEEEGCTEEVTILHEGMTVGIPPRAETSSAPTELLV